MRYLFRTPPGWTSAQIRRAGLGSILFGLLVGLPGVAFFLLTWDWALANFGQRIGDSVVVPRIVCLVVGLPMVAGYTALMIGVARLIFGKKTEKQSVAWGLLRLLFGVVFSIGLVVVALLIALKAR